MRMNKAIKRIVALGTGVVMVGATILGAMAAADLNTYPKPFVDNGAFNALIVVGSQAKTEDVLGSIDIATSLQYSTTVTKAIPGATATATVTGEGAKIETENNKLTIGEDLSSVKTKLDSSDLPVLLAKGTYVNDGDDQSTSYDYTQEIRFKTNPRVTFYEDTDYKDPSSPYVMLYDEHLQPFMTYTLDFTKLPESKWYDTAECGVAYELCDFEGTKISIMGVDYDVTKALWDGTSKLTWEMMGGTSLNTMYEGDTKTFTLDGKDYEVTVDIISGSSNTAVLTVNGQSTKELAKDQTTKVAGVELGVKKLLAKEAAGAKGLIEFYLGANKVALTDDTVGAGNMLDTNVQVASSDVDNLYSDWTVQSTLDSVKLQKLVLTWVPQDDLMLGPGDSATFPGLGSYRVDFAGLTTSTKAEQITLTPKGDNRIDLSAPLNDGTAKLDILYSDGVDYLNLGKSATAGNGMLYGTLPHASNTFTKGDYLILSNAQAEESHIVQLSSISTDSLVKFKDISSGTVYEGSCDSGCTINIGNTAITLTGTDPGDDEVTMTQAGTDDSNLIYTKQGLTIDLGAGTGDTTFDIGFREESSTGTLDAGAQFTVTADLVGTGKTSIEDVYAVADSLVHGPDTDVAYEVGDSTEKWASMTAFGTVITVDKSGDQHSAVISYPGEESHAQVFVNSIAAQVVNGGTGGATYQQVQKISVGAAVLDTEVADVTAQNVIVVGGPCVNTIAAQLMGNPTDCTAGFEDGKAMIKLFDQSTGKVAMLVAGYSAMDTRRASRVVANYDSYSNFAGKELEVTGTSLSDIKVGAPVAK